MVKLFSCKAHDGDYFWLRYKHDEEKLYHNLVIDGGRKSNASDFYEMLKHICKNGEQIDAMVLTHFDQDHIMGMFAGLQKAQKKNYIPKIAALYLNTGKGYWKHHQSLEGSEPLPEETVKIPMTDAPGYSANDLKKLTDFLQEYGLEEHMFHVTKGDPGEVSMAIISLDSFRTLLEELSYDMVDECLTDEMVKPVIQRKLKELWE